MKSILEKSDVIILCGGLGTRLRTVIQDKPKGLAPIGGKPFLDILIKELMQHGFRRFIFCVGHLGEQIISRYSDRRDAEFFFSQEEVPLGTGGAVQKALSQTSSNPIFVVNGDSFCKVDYEKLYKFHREKTSEVSFVLTKTDDRHDAGAVRLDDKKRVITFMEKTNSFVKNVNYINAGIYIFQKECIKHEFFVPPFSLEHDVFPILINKSSCFGFVVKSRLMDIGTPERYKEANNTIY